MTRQRKKKAAHRRHRRVRKLAVLLVLVPVLIFISRIFSDQNNDIQSIPYLHLIEQAAAREHLDARLVAAVIHQESRFDPSAESRVGAIGLMQVMPETASDIAQMLDAPGPPEDDLKDPETNLKYGTHYLRVLLDRFDQQIGTALAAYNAGPNIVETWLNDPALSQDGQHLTSIPYSETSHYVESVLHYFDQYQQKTEP